jgi:hypothetical protein|tara:strand:- start:243 stop:452 length:210 start_codon:yes stop_codon:yes gene_type:complete
VPFSRVVVKAPNGQILEELNDFHLLSKVKDVFKSKCDLEAEHATTKAPYTLSEAMWMPNKLNSRVVSPS